MSAAFHTRKHFSKYTHRPNDFGSFRGDNSHPQVKRRRLHHDESRGDPLLIPVEDEVEKKNNDDEQSNEAEQTEVPRKPHRSSFKTRKLIRPHAIRYGGDETAERNGDADDGNNAGVGNHSSAAPAHDRSAPEELSARNPVSRYRPINLNARSYTPIDPRFDDPIAQHQTTTDDGRRIHKFRFDTAYAFINDLRNEELTEATKRLRKSRDPDERAALKAAIAAEKGRRQREETERRRREALHDWHKKELSARDSGKNPYYLKKSDITKLHAVTDYITLKARNDGSEIKKVEKKRKQIASKLKKYIPK